jgi:hypothetical protein
VDNEKLYAEMCQVIGAIVMKMSLTGEVISKEILIEWLVREMVNSTHREEAEFYEMVIKFLEDG